MIPFMKNTKFRLIYLLSSFDEKYFYEPLMNFIIARLKLQYATLKLVSHNLQLHDFIGEKKTSRLAVLNLHSNK